MKHEDQFREEVDIDDLPYTAYRREAPPHRGQERESYLQTSRRSPGEEVRSPRPRPAPNPRQTARKRQAARRRRQQRRLRLLGAAAVVLLGVLVIRGIANRGKGNGIPGPRLATATLEDGSVVFDEEWIDVDLLPVNPYSRPGTELKRINGVVIHYVGNPGTTAEQNRSYFAGLADSHETSASAHFVIGTDGTVIECVPLNEISYCSNTRNDDTIAIECCHDGADGKFSNATEQALIRLVRGLCKEYGLSREEVIRHYDITGKDCPLYYVEHPDAWEQLLDDVFGD